MKDKIKALDKKVNIVFRETNGLTVIVMASIINFFLVLPLNLLFFAINPTIYLQLIKSYAYFNFLTISIIFIATGIFTGYYIFIESKMQYNNKKFYYSQSDESYEHILLFPISLIFSLLFMIFFSITIVFFTYPNITFSELYNSLNSDNVFVLSLIGTVVIFMIAQIYYKAIRYILYFFLNIWENVTFEFKDNVDYEINFAKANNTQLNLMLIKIQNLESVSKRLKVRKKAIFNSILSNLNGNLRNADIIIPIDFKRGVVGFLSRREPEELEHLMESKIRPFLEKKIMMKNMLLTIDVSYKIINVTKEEYINNFLELIEVTKDNFV